MMPKMGQPQPRLGFEMGTPQTAIGWPRSPSNSLKIRGNPSTHFVSCLMVWAAWVEVMGSSPTDGKLRASECVNVQNEITHSHICASMPPVGLEPATLTHLAQTLKQLTKWGGSKNDPPFLKAQKRTTAREFWRFRKSGEFRKFQ